jgi:hypothetical protein
MKRLVNSVIVSLEGKCAAAIAGNAPAMACFEKYDVKAVSWAIPTGTTRVSGNSPGRSAGRVTTATSDISRLASP